MTFRMRVERPTLVDTRPLFDPDQGDEIVTSFAVAMRRADERYAELGRRQIVTHVAAVPMFFRIQDER